MKNVFLSFTKKLIAVFIIFDLYSVTTFAGNGTFETHIIVRANDPINVTTQPVTPAAFCWGTTVTLTAAATGADRYIWQEEISAGSWSNISGANGSMNIAGETVSLTITNLTNTKKVRCLFTNSGGINTSPTSEVTLAPVQIPITVQPVDATDCYQNVVRFYVGASNVSYQWQRKKSTDADFVNLTDTDITDVSNTSTNYLRIVQAGSTNNVDGTLYRCKITSLTSPFCTNNSNAALILVNRFNTISVTKSPICVGESITFTSSIILGATRLQSYQWYKNNVSTGSISGANASTYTTTIATTSDNSWGVQGTFQSNNTGSTGITTAATCVTSQNRGITVRALPIAPTANSASRCGAGMVMLSATSALLANESFRWYETNISTTILATAATYTTSTLAVGTYTYYLSVYNSSTTCESIRTPVTVTVNALPTIALSSVVDICNTATSFSLPFSATTNSPNQYSISVGSPALSGFSVINNATLGSSPIEVIIPANATPNTYQFIISVKNSSGICVSIDQTFTVKINDTPAAPTVTSSVNYCQNAPTTILSATASGTNTLLWYGTSSSGGTSSLTAPSPSSSVIGTTSYYVSQKNTDNCESARAVIDVIANTIPNAPSATTTVAYCKNSIATVLSATAAGSNSLVWYDENDNILGAAPTPNTTTVGTQIFKVSQKSSSPASCESPRVSILVTVNDLPPVPIVTTSVGYCHNATATVLSATATSSNTLLWYGTNAVGGTSSGTAPTPLTASAGTMSYYVGQKDANNCESLRAKIDVEISANVSATISGTNAFCITGVLNSSATLTTNPTGGNGSYTYQWQNLAGNIASATSQIFEANSMIQIGNSDTYKVTVTSGYCTATANLTVTKQGWGDVPNVSVNPIGDICGSGTKTLSIVSPSAGTYRWYAAATTLTQTAAGTSFPTPNLTSTTTYYVAREQQITASLTCQTVRTAITVNVNAIPETPIIVNSVNKTTFCNNESGFTLSVSCTLGNGQYRLNSGSWTSGNSVAVTPSTYTEITTLNYDFKCSASATCESGVSSTSITINSVPNAPVISGNTSICSGSSTTLTASGCSGTVVWSNGVSTNSIIVLQSGTYNATCTVSGCVSLASLTQTVVVNQNPSITLGAISSVCNAATTFDLPYTATTNNPDKYSLISTMPDFVAVAETNLLISPIAVTIPSDKTGTHSFTLNIKNSTTGCVNSQVFNVTVLPILLGGSIEVSSNTINCAGYNPGIISSVSLASGGKVAYVYQWQNSINGVDFTDISTATSTTYDPAGLSQTTFYRRKVTDACGAEAYSSNIHQITIVPDPAISISSDKTNVCAGKTVSFSQNILQAGTGTCTTTWKSSTSVSMASATTEGTGSALLLNLSNAGTTVLKKYIQATYDCSVASCNNALSNVIEITINPNPSVPTIIGGGTICSGSSTTLTASGCNGTVLWSNGVTSTSISVNVAGSYTSTCVNACGTSASSNEIVVNITTINPPTLAGTTSVCSGQSTTLTATGCAGIVVWSNASSGTSITVSPSTTTSYTAVCTANTCTSASSEPVVVTVAPSIDFTVGIVADLCNSATSFNLPYMLTLGSPDKYSLTSTMAGFTSVTDGNLGISPISVTIPSGQVGTFSFILTLKISSTSCSKNQIFNVTVLPALLGGSIETSPTTINCAGYNPGSISSVSLASGGKVAYAYQWQLSTDNQDFTDILGENVATYDPPALTQTTYYRRKVTDACEAEVFSSNVYQIQIVPDPQITITDATDQTICTGGNISLAATIIGGSGTCTPTWQSSNTQAGTYFNQQVGGLSFTTTLVNATSSAITKYYRVIYACAGTGSGSCNQSTTAVVKVTVNPIPNTPTVTPASVVICSTQSVTLTASGCNGLITWNGGQTGSTLSVSGAGSYAAICTLNNCISVESIPAVVTVASGGTPVTPPVITGTATICNGQSTNLTATGCTGLVTWSNGNTGTLINVNPLISTDYTATCHDGTCTSNSSNKITVTVNIYPSITTQPKNEADCNGNSVTFSVIASSSTSYKWQRKIPTGTFTDISNPISNSLTISNVGSMTDPNQTEYRVLVSNGNCSVTSTVAVLTVNSVVGSLADQTICDGANTSFNLSNITISGNIQSYQWQRRVGTSGTWNDIVGATTTTLTINAATNADEQYYRCKVNFTAGSSTCARYTTEDDTNGAKLIVLVASTPNITGTNAICLGKNTTLTANNCDGVIAWSSGQSTTTITVSPTVNTSYSVSCTSVQCGFSVASAPYLVTVNVIPQPEIITYDVITPAILTFAARTTVPNTTLMWYNRASGGTGTTIAPSFSAVGTYSYWVTQTDPITGCESARLPIIAKVLNYFNIVQQPINQVDCKGNSVFFGVVAVGPNPAFTYQWQRKRPNEPDFVNLVEEGKGIRGWYARTMAVSNVGDVNNPNQTQYRCIVSNNGQALTSEISTLTVNSLEGTMPNLGICVGATNEFNLQNYFTITGNIMSYQWQTRPGMSGVWTNLNDENGISGSSKSTLKFTNAAYEQGVYYRCLVKFNTQGFECTEPTDAAKLIVSGFPPAPSVSSIFYCQNASAVRLKVDSPIQNLVWYSQETGGAGNTTAPTPNTNIAGVFKYYVADRTDEGCESPRAIVNVEVGALPSAPKNTTLTPINEGNVLTFSAEGTPAANQVLRWYTSPTITTFSITAPTFTAAGTYTRYVAQVSTFGCVGLRTAISATIIPSLKFTKQPLSQADCEGNSVTFTVSATAPSTFTYQWQRQKPSETTFTDLASENTNTLKISNIGNIENPNSTKYRCIIKDDKNTTISEEAILTVNQIVGTLATMSLCDGKASKLTFNSLTITGNIAEYQWQKKVGTSYTDIPTNSAGQAIINEIGTYRGKITFVVDKTTTCNRTTEDLKVEAQLSPVALQVSNQSACQNSIFDVAKSVIATNSLLWYESPADTTADKTTPKIDVSKLGQTTYLVSQINAFGCESERKSFDVIVSAIPEKPTTSDLTYCRNAPSVALLANASPQNQVLWYASLSAKDAFSKTPIPDTKNDGETIYFAAAKNTAGCESERVPLKVLVTPCIATFESNFNNCLQVSADSVKGNQWYDLYDKAGRLYASVNPHGLNLGKVSISIRHYGRGSAAIPATKNDIKLMARYADFQSSLLKEFNTPVSLRIYYENNEFNDYKIAVNLPNLSINDFNIVHYDGIREDCGFENNDNFLEGDSYVIFKNVVGNQIAKDFFYLQFDVNEFSENGATANDFTEITFSGKETENKTVQLNWQSKYEIKAEKYILERSVDCKNFTKIDEVKANGTSSIYENIDFQPLAGKSCYRLVYIDKDGTKKYLDATEVNFTDSSPICSVFPNPWTKGDEISLYLRNIKEKEIKLYDMRGQEFSFNMNENEAQIIKIRPDVHLSKGLHFLVVVDETGKKCVQKVIINP